MYNLERFKNKSLLLNVERAEGFLSVRVKSLKLLPPEYGHYIVLDSKDKISDARELLGRLSMQTDNGGNIPLSEFKVANVEIEMTQTPLGRRSEKVAFNLFYPNGCNLGDTPRDRLIRSYLVQWEVESGGTDEILRQLLLSLEQDKAISHFHVREWPEEVLSGLLEQRLLLLVPAATVIPCLSCEEQPLCDVKYRDEGGISLPYIACPQCGHIPLKEEDIRQFKITQDEIAAFIGRELGLSKGQTHKQEGLWDLGPYPRGESGDRVFLLRGESAAPPEEVKASLENECGLCFGLGLGFEKSAWLPKRLCFFPLRREIRFDGKAFHLDAERINTVYARFLENLKPELKDEFKNPRPGKLTLVGNVAERNRNLQAEWRKYLGIYKPEVQVYLFENETGTLDWNQAQRARFIFSGSDSSAASLYNRHLKNLERTAFSGNPALAEGYFTNPYKQRRKKGFSEE